MDFFLPCFKHNLHSRLQRDKEIKFTLFDYSVNSPRERRARSIGSSNVPVSILLDRTGPPQVASRPVESGSFARLGW